MSGSSVSRSARSGLAAAPTSASMAWSMPRARVVLFDVDNTLTASGGAGMRALEGALVDVIGHAGPMPKVAYAGRTDPHILAELLTRLGRARDAALEAIIMTRYLERLEDELARAPGRVLPGVGALLAALADRAHVAVGLLTGNVARGAEVKLRAHGLWDAFAFGAFGDDAETRPGLLPVALDRHRAATGRHVSAMADVFVIGDTVHDVAVARTHGAVAVAVGTGAPHQERQALLATAPDLFHEDLGDAAALLDALDA